jgi:hypothetical protein
MIIRISDLPIEFFSLIPDPALFLSAVREEEVRGWLGGR